MWYLIILLKVSTAYFAYPDTHTHTHIYIHIHTYIHTHTHTHTQICVYIYGIFILKIISKYLPVG